MIAPKGWLRSRGAGVWPAKRCEVSIKWESASGSMIMLAQELGVTPDTCTCGELLFADTGSRVCFCEACKSCWPFEGMAP